jgi:predicted nucleic acid-binding protein
VDTSVLLRIANPEDVRHGSAVRTLTRVRAEGARLVHVPQALAEFWVVATRPIEVNGLGASAEEAEVEMSRLLNFFELLPDPPDIFERWRRLVTGVPVVGHRAHDARLAAAYAGLGCDRLLTLDPRDFASLLAPAGLTLVPIEE